MLMIIIDDHCGVDDSHVDCDEMTRRIIARIIALTMVLNAHLFIICRLNEVLRAPLAIE